MRRISGEISRCSLFDSITYAGTPSHGTVAFSCAHRIAVWTLGDTPTLRRRWRSNLSSLRLSGDGSVLAESLPGDTSVTIRDTRTGRFLLGRRHALTVYPAGVNAPQLKLRIAFASDGKVVATVDEPGTISLYEVRSGRRYRTLYPQGQAAPGGTPEDPTAVTFSPDGTVVIAVTSDGTMLAWETKTGALIAASAPPGSSREFATKQLTFTPDGSSVNLLTTDYGAVTSFVTTWDLHVDDWVTDACNLVGRNLSRREWTTFIGTAQAYHRTCPQWPAGT